MTMISNDPADWDDQNKEEEAEDLGALGMTIKEDGALDDDLEDETPTEIAKPAVDVLEDEPLDGLARLDALERELEKPEIDLGEEEDI